MSDDTDYQMRNTSMRPARDDGEYRDGIVL